MKREPDGTWVDDNGRLLLYESAGPSERYYLTASWLSPHDLAEVALAIIDCLDGSPLGEDVAAYVMARSTVTPTGACRNETEPIA